jgi:poly-beta-1,6-N-acetyl-D-glucosamine synthase
MTWMFWISALFVVYTYAGYPFILWFRSKFWLLPISFDAISPSVSIVIAARDEAQNLETKIGSLRSLDYPNDKLEIIIASDGSSDATPEILERYSGPSFKAAIFRERKGKASALNHAVKLASGDILVFTDARQRLEAESVRNLVKSFADPEVGCVSGELMLGEPSTSAASGLGLYWRVEKKVRELESCTGSVIGATGAIYAMRRDLFREMPEGTILDDVFQPLHAIGSGYRVTFEPTARAWDKIYEQSSKEFKRKVRTLMGNYQLVRIAPWLISPKNPILFRFVSHKLCRLFVPIALIALLIASGFAEGLFYRGFLLAQVVFYAFALVPTAGPLGLFGKIAGVARSFILLNAAAAVAMSNVIRRKSASWG